MKALKVFLVLTAVVIVTTGCNSVYIRSTGLVEVRHRAPGVVITNKQVITEPVYHEEEYYEDYVTEETFITSRTEIWVGTTILIGGIHGYWCDFCSLWHPRCLYNRCFCAQVVTRHYGFYRRGHYYNHCYNWTYDPYYIPIVSTYRFKSDGRYYSYPVEQKKREFVKSGAARVSSERVRYRGKEVTRDSYNLGLTVKKNVNDSEKNSIRKRNDTKTQKGTGGVRDGLRGGTLNGTKKSGKSTNGDQSTQRTNPQARSVKKDTRLPPFRGLSTTSGGRSTTNVSRRTNSSGSIPGNGAVTVRKSQSNQNSAKAGKQKSILSMLGSILSKTRKNVASPAHISGPPAAAQSKTSKKVQKPVSQGSKSKKTTKSSTKGRTVVKKKGNDL